MRNNKYSEEKVNSYMELIPYEEKIKKVKTKEEKMEIIKALKDSQLRKLGNLMGLCISNDVSIDIVINRICG